MITLRMAIILQEVRRGRNTGPELLAALRGNNLIKQNSIYAIVRKCRVEFLLAEDGTHNNDHQGPAPLRYRVTQNGMLELAEFKQVLTAVFDDGPLEKVDER